MKSKLISIVDIMLIPVCFLFLLSSCVKIASYTFLNNFIFTETNWACGALAFFSCISLALTPRLHHEILALRLPLEEWLRMHHLRQ